jgi:hypothetical protein
MEWSAQNRGLLAFVSANNGKKRIVFAYRDFDAAFNVRGCAVLEKRPEELARTNFMGQPLILEAYKEKLELLVAGRST